VPLEASELLKFGTISGTARGRLGGLSSVLFSASMIASLVVVGVVGECESGRSSVRSRFSSPTTRFSNASSTSVFGPRFFGTASDICERSI
jgi:hypothetical protein